MSIIKKPFENLPQTPGVYIFKDKNKKILYIGKAANLKRRVSSYFTRPHGSRIQKMAGEIKTVNHKKTDSALEALILEAELIKKHQPQYNVLQKDDKTFLYVEITNEEFPRVLLVRGKEKANEAISYKLKARKIFGPFIYAHAIREGLRILRRIFSWSLHSQEKVGAQARPCFDAQVGLCPGTCVGEITKTDYKKIIRKIKLFFQGRKKQIIRELEREMKTAGKNLEFERAAKIKRQIFALNHIQDVAVLGEQKANEAISYKLKARRIEGYDISNISGTSAVGSMIVFYGDRPNKNEYRKFKIYSIKGQSDTGMIKEVLERRLRHKEWKFPDLMLIDGGRGQISAVKSVLSEHGMKIPVIGIAKGPKRKKNEFFGKIPNWVSENTLIRVRNEAHRFAIAFHKKLRAKRSMTK
ncbi:hypothetical protein CL629_03515 [bacterium]|nr:hypothetical protein [bacterium]|tara:strand:- start:5259 stop:6494 length:1236 start_codon:yes stop_codon:yes gene_type:complete